MSYSFSVFIILFLKYCITLGPQQSNSDNFHNHESLGSFSDTNFQYSNPQENNHKNEVINQQGRNRDDGVEQVEATFFEVKALLTKCVKPKQCDCDRSFECASNETHNSNPRINEYRTKCEEEEDVKVLQDCQKKIFLTLKIKNKGITNCKPQYIILDHVFDDITNKKQKLLNPYVLKITQSPVLQVFDLIFENIVNSGPSEKVVDKNNEGFTGCSTDPSNPTCGSVQYDNKEIPFSTGFCCSCDKSHENNNNTSLGYLDNPSVVQDDTFRQIGDQNNIQRDISNLGIPSIVDPSINNDIGLKDTNMPYLPGDNKNDYEHYGFRDKSGKIKENQEPINTQSTIPDNINYAPRIGRQLILKDGKDHENNILYSTFKKKKRVYKRGGQDCDDSDIPPQADPNTYHESAHCMEFSELWYSIFKIVHPNIIHSLKIQIFEKIGMRNGRISWREVTSSGSIFVGSSSPRTVSDDGSFLAYYTINNQNENEFALDSTTHRLLIPEVSGRDVDKKQYPELQGGPEEYLVVKESDMDLSGKSCNKAGVGYEAFVQQPQRCNVEKNSCLQNQPRQMWQHDHELEERGGKGCYFLRNYGCLPANPIRMKPCNGSSKQTQNKFLYMYYTSCFTSIVDINFAADSNVALRKDVSAMITEVYIESLNPKKVTITAKVLNSGLVTSIFYVGIGACPMEIPASFGSIFSQPVMITPQHQHIFTLEIYCELTIKNFYCSLEVLNMQEQLIAIRRIRFERLDRCICVWYCQCTCLDSDYGLKCSPLELEHFHATGFQGGMPVATQVINYSAFDDTVSVFLHIVLYFCLTLWYMGIIKAFLGCCILPIGLWGLDKILDLPKKINRYYETELRDQEVVYDEEGWPIHPETGKKVNNIAPATQFAVNMVFFLIFPFALIWNLVKKLLAPKYSTGQMFSDLDMCQCKASQITLVKDSSLQNSAVKRSSSNRSAV